MSTDAPRPLVASTPPEEFIQGQAVTLEATIPSDAQVAASADRARGRTTLQVGLPAAVVSVAAWLARLAGIDLNPLPGSEEMPAEIVASLIAIATVLLAIRMNPKNPAE